jgi:hypothetical protein
MVVGIDRFQMLSAPGLDDRQKMPECKNGR